MKTSAKKTVILWGATLWVLVSASLHLQATPRYEIVISDIAYEEIHKNWLFIPQTVDLRVEWVVSLKEVVNDQERLIYKEPDSLPFRYQIYVYHGDTQSLPEIKEVSKTNRISLRNIKMGNKFIFKVKALDENSVLITESELASIVVGKSGNPDLFGESWLYYLHPGRWQLASVGKAEIYDKSTSLGKLAFIFLSITASLSFLVLIYYSSRTLYLGNIFPYKRSTRSLIYSFAGSCDVSYEHRLTNKFRFILSAWKNIAAKSRQISDTAVKTIPAGLSSTEKMASVDVACLEYWTSDGDRAIGTIEDIIAFPTNGSATNRQTNVDDQLSELVIKIEDSFHDLIYPSAQNPINGANGANGANGTSTRIDQKDQKKMEALIDEIYDPVVSDDKLLSKMRKWLLRAGVFDLGKGLRPFPTSKIIKAGLEIHRMNGYRWSKPTEEVKRAFEDRASNEIEALKRKSKIEWFWNYGALAPLVGLFGTVTGITYAFQQLSQANVTPDFVNTIHNLSNGIFEALWTTIFGLANGILFIVIYHYFKQKLDWVYSKWEEIYVTITEKL